MRNQFALLFSGGRSCSNCATRCCNNYENKPDVVKSYDASKRARRKRGWHSPYIEVHSKHEKVLTFFLRALSRSSITGINRIASARSKIRRMLWSLVTFTCFIGFMFKGYEFAVIYNSYPTEVILRVENHGTREFPSVTICNNNRIRKSVYCKNYPEKCESNATHLGLSDREFLRIHKEAQIGKQHDFRLELGHSYTLINKCIFHGTQNLEVEECLKRFSLSFDPDFGNCYSFSVRGRDNGEYLTASEADFWQDENDFFVLFNEAFEEYLMQILIDLILLLDVQLEEFMERKREPGLILILHSDNALPDIHTDGIRVAPGFNYNFAVQQKSITRLLPLPYETNCTDFSALPWVSEGVELPPRMCTVKCSQHFQLKHCGYVTEKLSLFYRALPWDPEAITDDQIKCASRVELNTKNYCKSLCGVPCEDVRFEVAVDGRHLSEEAVHQELFSYLGGYSGVWLGFSLLNLYELLEIIFATLRFAFTKRNVKTHPLPGILVPPFYTRNSKKLFEEAIMKNSLFFARKSKSIGKLKSRKM
ncbi:uncharacterized protein CDAR_257241 [Caerostris darwini]|uniref:Uncharacterized protein n=1 Tax=Caerostris darwini TaxID=1538125 RepID=A0AAV4PJZ1_9ARAC|nr:uncharacterized protein CDAR_257241 [Caerostris darwini]